MGVKKENMSLLLKATIEYCVATKKGFVVYCRKCLKDDCVDDDSPLGTICSRCDTQQFASIPTPFHKLWEERAALGKTAGEIEDELLELIKKETP